VAVSTPASALDQTWVVEAFVATSKTTVVDLRDGFALGAATLKDLRRRR
jgi:hypothetical protein